MKMQKELHKFLKLSTFSILSLLLVTWLSGCNSAKKSPPLAGNSANSVTASQPFAASGNVLFTEVARQSGITFKHNLGATGRFYFIESTPPGCAFFDYDNDNNLDVFLIQSGAPVTTSKNLPRPFCALYHNQGDGTFTLVTAKSGLDKDLGYAQGATVGDYDNDGYEDIFVTSYGGNHLFRNLNGTGKFSDATKSTGLDSVHGTGYATSAAWGDYDNDGRLDLYVCYYAQWTPATDKACRVNNQLDYCSPLVYQPETHRLYHNEGRKFRDVSDKAGISKSMGRGLAVTFLDADSDGHQDIFVANDLTPNMLWHNNGNGTFKDIAVEAGCAYGEDGVSMAGMGVAISDYNRTGHESLFVTNFSGRPNIIFKNHGKYFQEVSAEANLVASHLNLLSFGCEFFDYDADGWQDLIVNNGHVESLKSRREPGVHYEQPKQLLHNEGNGSFRDLNDAKLLGDLSLPRVGRGLAVGDYDNDGQVDILAVNQNEATQLFKNQVRNSYHWVSFKTIGTKSNKDGLHTRFTVKTEGAPQTATVRTSSSFLSSSDRRVYFGLKSAQTIKEVTILWPSGTRETLKNLPGDTFYTLTEGKGITARYKPRL